MRFPHLFACALLAELAATPVAVRADHTVPFKGTWAGLTVAADLSTFPVVGVLAEGSGQVTELGRNTMVSHTTDVFTGDGSISSVGSSR